VGEACASLNDHVRTTVARMDASHCSGPIWLAAEFLDRAGEVCQLGDHHAPRPVRIALLTTSTEGIRQFQ
jgi:hypothetical protein